MVGITFDGRNIFKSNTDTVTPIGSRRMDQVRKANLERLFQEEDAKRVPKSKAEWNRIRKDHNTLREFGEKWPEAAGKIQALTNAWVHGERFNVIINSPDRIDDGDKTDAAYAWIDSLVNAGQLLYPSEEVVIVSEEEITRTVFGDANNPSRLFQEHPNMKILVVDQVLQSAGQVKFDVAWDRLLWHCRENPNGKTCLVLIVDPPLGNPDANGRNKLNTTSNSSGSGVKRKRTLGDVMEGADIEPGVDDILPLRKYRASYPNDCRMARGIIIREADRKS